MAGFTITLDRVPKMYLATYFAPCTLMVVVSWMSFLIHPDVVPGRLGLLLTLLLMMINLNNSVAAASPSSASLNPLLLWIIASEVFVFTALVEYALLMANSKFCRKAMVKPGQGEERKTATKGNMLDSFAIMAIPATYFCFVVNFIKVLDL